jgi:hypothetical protein
VQGAEDASSRLSDASPVTVANCRRFIVCSAWTSWMQSSGGFPDLCARPIGSSGACGAASTRSL